MAAGGVRQRRGRSHHRGGPLAMNWVRPCDLSSGESVNRSRSWHLSPQGTRMFAPGELGRSHGPSSSRRASRAPGTRANPSPPRTTRLLMAESQCGGGRSRGATPGTSLTVRRAAAILPPGPSDGSAGSRPVRTPDGRSTGPPGRAMEVRRATPRSTGCSSAGGRLTPARVAHSPGPLAVSPTARRTPGPALLPAG